MTETKKKAAPKKKAEVTPKTTPKTPKKDWLCANCIHLSMGAENDGWWCDAWCAHVSPTVVSGCVHRNAGEPFEE